MKKVILQNYNMPKIDRYYILAYDFIALYKDMDEKNTKNLLKKIQSHWDVSIRI